MHQKIKKTISWIIGLPSAIIVVSELNDFTYWWVQFVALGLLVLIFYWNGAFTQNEHQTNYQRGF